MELDLDIPKEKPHWLVLKHRHNITVSHNKETDTIYAVYNGAYYETGETEREAVVALLHQLKLEGWETVSIEP